MRKILIIGAGGIGSFLIPILARTKLYKIRVADPDIVEKKNLPYQNYEEGMLARIRPKLCMIDTFVRA